MTCDAIRDFVTDEVKQTFEDVHNLRDLWMGGRNVHHIEREGAPSPETPPADNAAVDTAVLSPSAHHCS